MSVVQIRVLGGQVARVPAAATAFAHRDRPMIVNVVAAYADPDQRPEHEEWADSVRELVRLGSRGAYVNLHADDSEASLRDIYPGATWHRLVEVKKDYDPDNLFQSNHNIVPGDR
jgi:FAD/FMN-containing dehydrogenase